MQYLILSDPTTATTRSEDAGKDASLGYHSGDPDGCRYIWGVRAEDGANPRAALNISGLEYLLTPAETTALVDDLPADWQYPSEVI
tara:strand:- start:214 stop:471 length:258 start_codon:yes stop_codon:yes gene_type:complete